MHQLQRYRRHNKRKNLSINFLIIYHTSCIFIEVLVQYSTAAAVQTEVKCDSWLVVNRQEKKYVSPVRLTDNLMRLKMSGAYISWEPRFQPQAFFIAAAAAAAAAPQRRRDHEHAA